MKLLVEQARISVGATEAVAGTLPWLMPTYPHDDTRQPSPVMHSTPSKQSSMEAYLSALKLMLIATNGVCFGGLMVLLIIGGASGPLLLLTIGAGLSFLAGLAGAIMASRKRAGVRV